MVILFLTTFLALLTNLSSLDLPSAALFNPVICFNLFAISERVTLPTPSPAIASSSGHSAKIATGRNEDETLDSRDGDDGDDGDSRKDGDEE